MNDAPLTVDQVPQALRERFARLFGEVARIYKAPGRVNLIGEHTDYNDGFVMPAAVGFYTWAAVAPRNDHKLIVRSENLNEQVELQLDQFPAKGRHHWSDYVIGVAKMLTESGVRLGGANVLLSGDVPQGAGLSSSASLEVAVCSALLGLAQHKLGCRDIALLCQRAENEFVGARCGIMDQFVSSHGRRDRALLLDCRSLEYRLLPLPHDVRLVICNTMVRHNIAHGEYNQRRAQCEEGAHLLAQRLPKVRALRDVTESDFAAVSQALPEVVRRRCRHVIGENERVIRAATALEHGDLVEFGRLMHESHDSLRQDFEVSCKELDLMVELSKNIRGVYGSRMTGGGFGGCTVNLVQKDCVDKFVTTVDEEYERATGIRPEIYVCVAADGACEATS
jgi:galactokinase